MLRQLHCIRVSRGGVCLCIRRNQKRPPLRTPFWFDLNERDSNQQHEKHNSKDAIDERYEDAEDNACGRKFPAAVAAVLCMDQADDRTDQSGRGKKKGKEKPNDRNSVGSYLLLLNGHSDLRAAVRTEDAIAAEVLSAFRTKHVSILRDKMINFLQ